MGSLVLVRVWSDVGKQTPTVKPYEPKRDGGATDGLEDVFGEAGFVDKEGGADQSVVKIEKIIGRDGSVSWRIVLPSTQDWQALARFMSDEDRSLLTAMQDSGAVNDVDSNMALVLFPSLRTQYERAVLEAMDQAGCVAAPTVTRSCWSDSVRRDPRRTPRSESLDQYNFDAIVVCGAPDTDNMLIPDSTRVICPAIKAILCRRSISSPPPPQRDNWQTITDAAPGDPTDVSQIQ